MDFMLKSQELGCSEGNWNDDNDGRNNPKWIRNAMAEMADCIVETGRRCLIETIRVIESGYG